MDLVNVLNGLAIGLLLFSMAAGLSLIFGLMDILNLAHGASFLAGTYVAFELAGSGNLYIGVAGAIGVGVVLGVLLSVAMRPLASRPHLDQALVTLGFSIIMAEIISVIWGNEFLSVAPPPGLQGEITLGEQTYPVYRLAVIGVGVLVAVAIYALFERTKLGAIVRASVSDRAMVSALGINPRVVTFGVLTFGVALATFAGAIAAPVMGPRPGLDLEVLFLALIVVVIGGLGSMRGALVGGLIVGQVQSVGPAVAPEYAPFLLFGALALVLTVRKNGLFGDVTR